MDVTKKNNQFVRFFRKNKLVVERIQGQQLLVFLYTTFFGRWLRTLFITRWAANIVALYYSSRLSKRKIKPFIKAHEEHIDMHDFVVPAKGFQSFNDFFIRSLKPEARTFDQNPLAVTSPADSKLFVVPDITQTSTFFIKNQQSTLAHLLGSAGNVDHYAHATMFVFRLAPYDYHRFHLPIDGTLESEYVIDGLYESVNPLVFKNNINPFIKNKRHVMCFRTEQKEHFVMIAVGALFVGRTVLQCQRGVRYRKGDVAGYFEFGGSTVILIFTKGCVRPLDALVKNSAQGFETAVHVGSRIADIAKK